MSKLTYEDKKNMYSDKKNGMSIIQISNKYKVRETTVKYIYRLIEVHGYDILRTTKNKYYSSNQKEKIINRVLLNNESITSVSIDEGLLNPGILANWIKKYKNEKNS